MIPVEGLGTCDFKDVGLGERKKLGHIGTVQKPVISRFENECLAYIVKNAAFQTPTLEVP